jgi:serine/threonine protein kinase
MCVHISFATLIPPLVCNCRSSFDNFRVSSVDDCCLYYFIHGSFRNKSNDLLAVHIFIFSVMCVAVMHELRLIHTDLKPENILLVSSEYTKVPDYKVYFVLLLFCLVIIFVFTVL